MESHSTYPFVSGLPHTAPRLSDLTSWQIRHNVGSDVPKSCVLWNRLSRTGTHRSAFGDTRHCFWLRSPLSLKGSQGCPSLSPRPKRGGGHLSGVAVTSLPPAPRQLQALPGQKQARVCVSGRPGRCRCCHPCGSVWTLLSAGAAE